MTGKSLIVVLGPTGVGKTDVSIELAERLGTCILNADSRQVFKDLQIGTASPTQQQLRRVKHYFVGFLPLTSYYSAAKYEQDAIGLLGRLFAEKQVVIMSGGSMLYTDAVCNGIDDIPTVDECTRNTLRERLAHEGLAPLLQELRLLDPAYYAEVDPRNPRRVVHALEICYMTGRPYSSFRTRKRATRPFNIVKIGLRRERNELFERINSRVDAMMANGLLDEARRLYPLRHLNSLNTVGYKELFRHISGEWPLSLAIEKMKRSTRIYAKKQMTWYGHDNEVSWFHPSQIDEMMFFIKKRITNAN